MTMLPSKSLSPEALSLLQDIAEAPDGLRYWPHIAGIEKSPAWRECVHGGLAHMIPANKAFLTDVGVAMLGVADYTANDPSTWPVADAEKFFLRGLCHALAVALHRRLGFEIVAVTVLGQPIHVMARSPGGDLYDFDGLTSLERVKEDAGVSKVTLHVYQSEGDFFRQGFGGNGQMRHIGPHDIRMAERFIDGCPDRFPLQAVHEHLPEEAGPTLGFP